MTVFSERRERFHALRIAAVYAVAAIGWILLSDLLISRVVPAETLIGVELAKGVVFVLVTALLLYLLLVQRELRLARDEARVELLLGQIPGLLWTTDRELRIRSLLGSIDGVGPPEDGFGVGDTVMAAATTAENRAVIESNHRRALAGRPADYLLRLGSRNLAVRVEPVRDAAGGVSGTVGFALEVTTLGPGAQGSGSVRDALQRNQLLGALGGLVLDVAHQIKNPLFALSAALDAFEERTGDHPATVRHREILRQQVQRMEGLVSGLQVYGRVADLTLQDAELVTLVRRAISDVEADRRAAGLELEVRLPETPLPVRADPDVLVGAFRRVLQNGVQSAPAGSVLEIVATGAEDTLEVSVADRGAGFDPDDLERVFEPMFARRPGGAGLGLAITERIVRRHGGEMSAANRPGGGARVTIRLPVG